MIEKQQTPAGPATENEARARHGYRNEVNWEGGSGRHEDPPLGHARAPGHTSGRQPYSNQPPEVPSPAASEEYAEGNRAERSGTNLDQLERVKRRP